MAGEKDDRRQITSLRKLILKIETARIRHSDVEDDAGRAVRTLMQKKIARRGEAPRLIADGTQETIQPVAHGWIVVDHINGRSLLLHILSSCLSVHWQGEAKYGPVREIRCRIDGTTMRFDNRPADCEPHSHAIRLGRVESFEYPAEPGRRHTNTCVAHADRDLAFGGGSADEQLTGLRVDISQGFNRVHDKIEDHLLKLHAIAGNEWQIIRQLGAKKDLVLPDFAANELQHIANRLDQIEHIARRRRPRDELANTSNDIARPVSILDDPLDGPPCLLLIGRRSRKPSKRGIAIRRDRRDRLTDFMGNRCAKLADNHQARHPRKFGLRLSCSCIKRLDPDRQIGRGTDGNQAENAVDQAGVGGAVACQKITQHRKDRADKADDRNRSGSPEIDR
ncbi:hypothetical protein RHSP_48028 [Rhizobium freirei PRF 81]|uniref:Uncharacterized protein n=1 Tax=Rhizobium freirei PRF 81 TaxID=363754 RepID=N6UCG6_9HYPH|nr:hypothetical protein RHSP_48028 [Rhizobium freirei PRF 81]